MTGLGGSGGDRAEVTRPELIDVPDGWAAVVFAPPIPWSYATYPEVERGEHWITGHHPGSGADHIPRSLVVAVVEPDYQPDGEESGE